VTPLEAVAGRVSSGEALTASDAEVLAAAQDIVAVGAVADEVRRALHGDRTTFLRVFEVHVDAIPASLPQGLAAGEIRIVGEPPSLAAAREAVQRARALADGAWLSGFSLATLRQHQGGIFEALREAGLDAIAEAPVDGTAAGDVAAARAAGLAVPRLTVDCADDGPLAARALALRDFADRAGAFEVLAPLPRRVSAVSPTTGYDDVKMIALARLFVRTVPRIQVDWPLYGPKLAQVGLIVGADDVDGVAAVESGALGPRRSALEEVRRNIQAAGGRPVERDGRFRELEG
jgi:aminodeoxyfutalosine synthase